MGFCLFLYSSVRSYHFYFRRAVTAIATCYLGVPQTHRNDKIRTCDPLIPNQVLCQSELHPEIPFLNQSVCNRTRTDNLLIKSQLLCQLSYADTRDPNEIRTRVTAVKGRCLNRLTMGPYYLPSLSLFRALSRQPFLQAPSLLLAVKLPE